MLLNSIPKRYLGIHPCVCVCESECEYVGAAGVCVCVCESECEYVGAAGVCVCVYL